MRESPPPVPGTSAPRGGDAGPAPRGATPSAEPGGGPADNVPSRTLRLLPAGTTVACPPGGTVLEAAASAGVSVEAPCGGRRLCGRCRVAYESGAPAPNPVEVELIRGEDLAAGIRLACRSRPDEDATVRVLPPARLDGWKLAAGSDEAASLDPDVRVVRCRPPHATLERPTPAATWLRAQVGDLVLPLPVLRTMRNGLGDGQGGRDGDGTEAWDVVAVGEEVAEVAPAPREGPGGPVLGAALDIGTTTVVAFLLDLRTGRQLAAASTMNPQASFGADLISRLHAVLDDAANAQRLRDLVVAAAGRLITRCCRQAGCDPSRVFQVTVAANTCMHHLFLGLDASVLARSPFAPVVAEGLDLPAADVGLPVHPRGRVYLLPNVAGFVGADTMAGLLASGLASGAEWRLLLDIGTNAEIVLGRRGRLLTCSAAAGPAFEGGNISCGTVAREGAVSHVRWDGGRLRTETVGGSDPVGLCGSGLLDAVRVLVELGVVAPSGRIAPPERWPAASRAGVGWADATGGVVLAEGAQPVVLTQRDVRELQLAKGAVRAACELLLRTAGIGPADLGEVLLAGAFGNYLDPESVLSLGLIPPVDPARLRSIGNAAGTGARLVLLNRQARDEAAALREQMEYVELSVQPGFQDAFAEGMVLGAEG